MCICAPNDLCKRGLRTQGEGQCFTTYNSMGRGQLTTHEISYRQLKITLIVHFFKSITFYIPDLTNDISYGDELNRSKSCYVGVQF